MGTQQILMIVLSVIIVGIAAAVGITMFSNQAMNSNRQAVIGDLQNFGANFMAYFRTPTMMGGAGGDAANVTQAGAQAYMGWDGNTFSNANGTYTLTAAANSNITVAGVGTETGTNGTSGTSATLTVYVTSATNPDSMGTVINN